jgi:uncharacterized membrane protein
MTNQQPGDPATQAPSSAPAALAVPELTKLWHGIRNRVFEGLLVVLPILITLWIIHWLFKGLENYVIDPLAVLVIWKVRQLQSAPELPYWFETYVAPVIAIFLAFLILYCCGALAHSWLRRVVDRVMLRVPGVSHIYDAVRNVLDSLAKPNGQASVQRVVLVSFPHPGMRVPAIVTSMCRDIATGKTLLCVYIPTTPVPGSGFFLIVPEEEATELNWDVQQALQAIFSGGLTAPPNITYYQKSASAAPAGVGPVASSDGGDRP